MRCSNSKNTLASIAKSSSNMLREILTARNTIKPSAIYINAESTFPLYQNQAFQLGVGLANM